MVDWLCWKLGIGWTKGLWYFCAGGYEEHWTRKSDGQVRVLRYSSDGIEWRILGHDKEAASEPDRA